LHRMIKFRNHIAAKLLAFMTGVIFLNMSFFMCEIRLLGLHVSHTKMIENVVKALAGVGFEEEKDSLGETAEGESGLIVDLHMTVHHLACIDSFITSSKLYDSRHNLEVSSGKTEIIIPPPKHS
jgi:hypothetical protein